jgi:NAD(P)-dependent dehydrogenase (short-subunit alcohol dehydrogenase family)
MKTRAKNELGDESRYSELMKDLPLGRAARPREIGDMAVFLASDRSTYTSGVIITIDGAR